MRKKITFDIVRNFIESIKGYTLLSTEYTGSKNKLKIKCGNGHLFEITYDNFKQGKRCYECKRTRWNIEKVKDLFDQKGLILTENEYINTSTKMEFRCKIHSDLIQHATLGSVQQGKGCKICGIEKVSRIRRNSVDDIIKKAKDKNFKIMNPENYKNVNSMLEFECINGHKFTSSYSNMINLSDCKKCKGIISETEENVREFAKNRGYKLLLFVDRNSNIQVECPNKHTTHIAWRSFRNGQECTECTGLSKTKYEYKQVKEIFKNSNMILLSDSYKNINTPLKFQCTEGHVGEMMLSTVLKGSGCMECGRIKAIVSRSKTFYENGTQKTSKQQRRIHEVIGGEINFPMGFYSLDVAFPEEKIYLEYDGGGHDLSVKIGQMSQEDFNRRSLIRSVFLSNNGWKEIRIISDKNLVPSEKKLKDMLNDAKHILNNGRTWVRFNIDNNRLITSKFEKEYEFELYEEL